jgi:hypothetical protein
MADTENILTSRTAGAQAAMVVVAAIEVAATARPAAAKERPLAQGCDRRERFNRTPPTRIKKTWRYVKKVTKQGETVAYLTWCKSSFSQRCTRI